MRIITSEDIRAHISMSDLIQEVRRAYLLLKDGKSITPLRTVTDPGGNRPKLLYKPSYDCTNGQMAVKLLSQLRQTSPEGYPTIQGLIVLFDGIRNTILSVMDGRHVTALRTGAASGLASALLSRKDSSVLAVFGAGAQAYTQIQAVLEVRDIRKVIVFDIIPAALRFVGCRIRYFHRIPLAVQRSYKHHPPEPWIRTDILHRRSKVFQGSACPD